MNRFQWALATLLVLMAQCAFADSIPTFSITTAVVGLGINGEASFSLTGPGIGLFGFGGLSCLEWCWPDFNFFPPGSGSPVGFGFDGQFFLGGDGGVIGGKNISQDSLDLTPFLALNPSGGFLFPTNPTSRSTFTACQPASIPSSFAGFAGSDDPDGTPFNFNLTIPAGGNGKFCSTWSYVPPLDEFPGGFQFERGKFTATTVPEPGTLGLMGSGLAGIVGAVLRKWGCKCTLK